MSVNSGQPTAGTCAAAAPHESVGNNQAMPDLEPIEQYLRPEVPPDDVIVVVRGGPIAAEKIVEHAAREARDRSYNGAPMHSVSVSLTVGGRSLDDLLAGPLASRSTFAQTTVGLLREAKYTLLPTYAAPHYDLLLASGSYDDATKLLRCFSDAQPNPFKARRGQK